MKKIIKILLALFTMALTSYCSAGIVFASQLNSGDAMQVKAETSEKTNSTNTDQTEAANQTKAVTNTQPLTDAEPTGSPQPTPAAAMTTGTQPVTETQLATGMQTSNIAEAADWVEILIFNISEYIEEKGIAHQMKEEKAVAKHSQKKKVAKKLVTKKTVSAKKTYSKKDLRLLSSLVYAEAGNQSYEGMLAVANVVLNRVNSKAYSHARTIKDVVYDRKWSVQFAVTIKNARTGASPLDRALNLYDRGNFRKTKLNPSEKSMKKAIRASKAALHGKNNIGKYLCFTADRDSRSIRSRYSYRIMGAHIFYRNK